MHASRAPHASTQVMLRQAAEEKESAIKMRAALQAELAQKQPQPCVANAASAVATSQQLHDCSLHLQAWACARSIDDVMQDMLHELCPQHQQPHAAAACTLAPALEPWRVLQMCASMSCASDLLLQPAAPQEASRGSQQASERHERAAAQAAASRDAALQQNVELQEVCACCGLLLAMISCAHAWARSSSAGVPGADGAGQALEN